MRSVRMNDDMEDKLERAAAASGLSPSEIVRRGTEVACDSILGQSAFDLLKPFIGKVRSRRTPDARQLKRDLAETGFGLTRLQRSQLRRPLARAQRRSR